MIQVGRQSASAYLNFDPEQSEFTYMKQVDFYLINNQIANAKFKLASRLANKLQRSGKYALVVTEDESTAKLLDQTMWTYNDASFLAHDDLTEKTPSSRIHIGAHNTVSQAVIERNYDVLINLASDIPMFNHHFERIAEIVEADESSKAAGRTRFKSYKNEGFELKMHKIEL